MTTITYCLQRAHANETVPTVPEANAIPETPVQTNANPADAYYKRIDGSVFESVFDKNGNEYKFKPTWWCTGFADETNPRIPMLDKNYVFQKEVLIHLLTFLMYPENSALWLTGPTGCGKTSAIMQILARLNWPVVDMTLHSGFEFTDLKGQWGLTQDKNEGSATMKFIENALPLAMKNGWVLVLNEVDYARPGELAALNDIIQGGCLTIAEKQGEIIKPHPMFRLIVTGNSNGAGDDTGLYMGVQQQNVAAMDRYRMVKVSYPTIECEEGILNRIAPTLLPEMRHQMCAFAQEMRKCFTTPSIQQISVPISTRTLVNWAKAVPHYSSFDVPVRTALELFFTNKLSEEEAMTANSVATAIFGSAWDGN